MTLTDGLERQTTLIARPADSSPRNKKCSDSNKIPSARSRAPDSRLGCRVILDDDPGHLLRAPTSGTYFGHLLRAPAQGTYFGHLRRHRAAGEAASLGTRRQ